MKNNTLKRLSTALLGSLLVLGLASTAMAERKPEIGPVGGFSFNTERDLASCPVGIERLTPGQQAAVNQLLDQRDRDVAALNAKLDAKQDIENKDRTNLDVFADAGRQAEIQGLEAKIDARDNRFDQDVAAATGNHDLGGALLASNEDTNCVVR